jgi:hypothetical protein
VATAFGTLAVVRAGRLARLDATGRPAFRSVAAAVSQLTGDSFTPAASADSRFRPVAARALAGSGGHSHSDETAPGPGWPQPANLTWGDVVVLEVEFRNTGQELVLFGPGQLRLKLLRDGTTVTPQDAGRSPGAIAPGTSELVWVSYLAPPEAQDFELEYKDAQHHQVASLPLRPLNVTQVRA